MTVLIDTDILVEVLRGEDSRILSLWSALANTGTALLFSPISAAEVWAGARASEHVHITRLFRPLLCVPVDPEIGKLAGEYLHKFSRSQELKLIDALIAASAIRHQAALWTRHRDGYPMPQLPFYD